MPQTRSKRRDHPCELSHIFRISLSSDEIVRSIGVKHLRDGDWLDRIRGRAGADLLEDQLSCSGPSGSCRPCSGCQRQSGPREAAHLTGAP